MIFAVFDPSPLTLCINCSFLHLYRIVARKCRYPTTAGHFQRGRCLYFHFTARRYASAVYAVVVCPFVHPSVCPSQGGTVPKWLNVGSRKQRPWTMFVCKKQCL